MVDFSGTGGDIRFSMTVAKSSDETVTSNSATLITDTHLDVALTSATVFKVGAFYSTTQGGGIPVFKWDIPSGANLNGVWSARSPSAGASFVVQTVTEASSYSVTTADTRIGWAFTGVCETSAAAGNIVPLFRQQDADATATIFRTGSWITVQQANS